MRKLTLFSPLKAKQTNQSMPEISKRKGERSSLTRIELGNNHDSISIPLNQIVVTKNYGYSPNFKRK